MIEKDSGFILRRYNFRETSLIASIYTYKFGKIRGIFKGFYSKKREFSSGLDIFSLNEFIFYPKRSEIWLVSHADLVSDYYFLRENISKAKVAAVIFNFIDKTMQLWDRNTYVFNLVNNCLNLLEEERSLKILYIFLIKFLTLSGFEPEFNHCLDCKSALSDDFLFSASKGGLLCQRCSGKIADAGRISAQASKSLLYIQNTDFPLVCRLNSTLKCEEEILSILKSFVSYHFGFDGLVNIDIAQEYAGV